MDGYPMVDGSHCVSEPIRSGISRHTQLETYALAFDLANMIYGLSKSFPAEERFSLTDQIRRSSRSVCANIAEAWRKRRFKAAFQNALNHAEAEAAETQTWIQFARECGYIESAVAARLNSKYESVLKMLVRMITHPQPWLLPTNRSDSK